MITPFEIFYSVLMILIFVMIGTSLVYEKKARISPTPVLSHVRRKAVSLIPDRFLATGPHRIADLGCGWGGLLMALSRKFPSSNITGYEISPWPYWFSKLKALTKNNVRVLNDNFFDDDLSAYDIVFCYLSPWHMEHLKPQLSSLKSGSVVVSCSFPIEGWNADQTVSVKSLFVRVPVFLYVIK